MGWSFVRKGDWEGLEETRRMLRDPGRDRVHRWTGWAGRGA